MTLLIVAYVVDKCILQLKIINMKVDLFPWVISSKRSLKLEAIAPRPVADWVEIEFFVEEFRL